MIELSEFYCGPSIVPRAPARILSRPSRHGARRLLWLPRPNLRLDDVFPQPHAAPPIGTRTAPIDELDPGVLKCSNQLHEGIDVSANHAVAGLHPLYRRNGKPGEACGFALVDIQQRPRSSQLICCNHKKPFTPRMRETICLDQLKCNFKYEFSYSRYQFVRDVAGGTLDRLQKPGAFVAHITARNTAFARGRTPSASIRAAMGHTTALIAKGH